MMNQTMNRRDFLQHTLILAPMVLPAARSHAALRPEAPAVRLGLLTDIHYANKPTAGTRHYRDSIAKLGHAIAALNEHDLDFAVELGDFIDSSDSLEGELKHLHLIDRVYSALKCDRHYVLGNHCVNLLTKREFVDNSGARAAPYSFNHRRWHFVVLDACFRTDGVDYERHNFHWQDTFIPSDQLHWLANDLGSTDRHTLVFIHQRLDDTEHHSVKNAADVRAIMEAGGNVRAVLQGHSHANAHVRINGIHYCVIRAVIEGAGLENSGYAVANLFDDGSIRLHGYVRQADYDLRRSSG